jgi:hypothetical protein
MGDGSNESLFSEDARYLITLIYFRLSIYASFTIPKPSKSKDVLEFNSGTIKIFAPNSKKCFKEKHVHITLISFSHLNISFLFYFNNEKPLSFLTAPTSVVTRRKKRPVPVFVNSKKYKSKGQTFRDKHNRYIED